MIDIEQLKKIVDNHLLTTDRFLVEAEVKKNNLINVFIDSESALHIDHCIEINHLIHEHFNQEENDYELNVSSPGADAPIKNIRQLKKAIGKEFVMQTKEGKLQKGILTSLDATTFTLAVTTKEKVEGQKSKQLINKEHTYQLSDLSTLKRTISFK